jgi:hypothetical protein
MGDRLHHAVALPAGIFRVANAAGGIGLYVQLAMSPHPGQIMAGRFNIPIHINVAGLAILSGGMGFIADLHNVIALQFWYRGKVLIKHGLMAFPAGILEAASGEILRKLSNPSLYCP